jgi:hypothetical protein
MKTIVLTLTLITIALFVSAQEKAVPNSNKSENIITTTNTVVTNKAALKAIEGNSQNVEKRRADAPVKEIERSAEMIERKKTAPMMSEPQL